ncbi:MAG: ABC transporter permease [Alphaproteobacteria bacterium]|nr:ABC transporter permease [Alphaproteobacteria bacterium]MDE1931402.1 ABC transporter permease [Alphaproteobacteria bacterium]
MIAVPQPWRGGGSLGSPLVVLAAWLCGGVLLAFILLPLLQLVAVQTAGTLLAAARATDVQSALMLSVTASVLTALVAGMFGVPFAYFLARADFVGKSAVAAIVDVPLTVPHTVAGIALLMVFGRHGVIGGPAEEFLGLRFWGTLAGIVVAMLFVSLPYTVNAARIAFEGVDPRLEMVARTLGLGPWRVLARITVPLAWRGIATGLTLTFARSISEFGAVVILVYYPMTAPVQIYEMFLRYGLEEASAVALLLLVISLALFILFRHVAYGRRPVAGGGR